MKNIRSFLQKRMADRKYFVRNQVLVIILSFLLLYLFIVIPATFLVAKKKAEEFRSVRDRIAEQITMAVQVYEETEQYTAKKMEMERQIRYREILSLYLNLADGDDQKVSAAIYDETGEFVAKSQTLIGEYPSLLNGAGGYRRCSYPAADYLNEEEIDTLATYMDFIADDIRNKKEPFYLQIFIKTRGEQLDARLAAIQVRTTDDNNIIWGWENKDLPGETEGEWTELAGETTNTAVNLFPYITNDQNIWRDWEQNEFLHNFPSRIETMVRLTEYNEKIQEEQPGGQEETENSSVHRREQFTIPLSDGNPSYYLLVADESHPWLAAMREMTALYLISLLFLLLCGSLVIWFFVNTWKKQAALEEVRLNFTNAAAHELKTPLGIIRAFAENLKENTVEEKRDYYLERIIGQTEEMDSLAAEMIDLSRLDSNRLILKNEEVSFAALIEAQLEKLQFVIREKEIQVYQETKEDFTIKGDAGYLEKAVWNILSNAVSYNVLKGTIWITVASDGCTVVNTGSVLTQEQLEHAFDMFYRGDESRNSGGKLQQKHAGLGLYLTRKILHKHHLQICMENTENGVKVAITK
ncbi:MAG: HAMP domain-containing sensor histidine kinase [Lachnospiraceae bacterium]|nr:HAMP domain-containing sensor histidine kinase [Lachnospiraceae bacterium]